MSQCALVPVGHCRSPQIALGESEMHLWADYETHSLYHPWCCDNPDCLRDDEHLTLPEGWVLDPAVTEHRPEIGVWWVILPDGTRTAWNAEENNVHCPACRADKALMPDCSTCKGRGHVDNVPFCDRPWDEVVPGLWLGGHDCQPAGAPPVGDCHPGGTFDVVVSLYERGGLFDPHDHVHHLRHRMADADLDAEHHTRLDELATHVEDAVRRGLKVLVRCQAGINRSALVVGMAMLRMGWTADDAIARMREVRSPFVLFNQSFVAHLREVESRRTIKEA